MAARARDAWVSFQVTVSQETRRGRRERIGAPVRVSVALIACGYNLADKYRTVVAEETYELGEHFSLAGDVEHAAELACDALRKAYPGLF